MRARASGAHLSAMPCGRRRHRRAGGGGVAARRKDGRERSAVRVERALIEHKAGVSTSRRRSPGRAGAHACGAQASRAVARRGGARGRHPPAVARDATMGPGAAAAAETARTCRVGARSRSARALAHACRGSRLLVRLVLDAPPSGASRSTSPLRAGGHDFGTATAAYQIEGSATAERARGPPSLGRVLAIRVGATANGDTRDVACDHYHRFGEDVELMAQLGVREYRWQGRRRWRRLGRTARSAVERWGRALLPPARRARREEHCALVTLYHRGHAARARRRRRRKRRRRRRGSGRRGWRRARRSATSSGSRPRASTPGARVRRWATFNEPFTFIRQGYSTGVHAPGRCTSCEAGGDSAVEPFFIARASRARARARPLSFRRGARRARRRARRVVC